jgi:hypothetical protein
MQRIDLVVPFSLRDADTDFLVFVVYYGQD